MISAVRKLFLAGVLLVFLGVAMALRDDDEKIKEIRSPAINNNNFTTYKDEQPLELSFKNLFAGGIDKFFNDFLQFPTFLLRFVSEIIANQPFAKLREEARNLNISYPK